MMNNPSWSDCPEWAAWWAVDTDGECCYFEHDPIEVMDITGYGYWVRPTLGGSVSVSSVPDGKIHEMRKERRP